MKIINGKLPESLIVNLRRLSQQSELGDLVAEYIYNSAKMRHHQKTFFKEKGNTQARQEHLDKSKELERLVDELLEKMCEPAKQSNLFGQ